jgi:hypothetical protein
MNELPKFGYGDSAFNLRFDANTWSGIAVAVHLNRRCYKGATPQIEWACYRNLSSYRESPGNAPVDMIGKVG